MSTYWDGSGCCQKKLDKLQALIPDYGYTPSPALNALIAASRLYYDVYNNGGCNIRDCYMEDYKTYLKPFMPEFSVNAFLRGDKQRMEELMDELIIRVANLRESEIQYEPIRVWCSHDLKALSMDERSGGDWFCVTFGTEQYYTQWTARFLRQGYAFPPVPKAV